MTKKVHEIIKNMSDVEVVRFLDYFGRELFTGVSRDAVLDGVSPELKGLQEYHDVVGLDEATRKKWFGPEDSALVARTILEQMANDRQMATAIVKAWEEYKPDELFVEAILAVGVAASLVVLMASGIEVEFKGVKIKKEATSTETVKAVAEAMFGAIGRLVGG